MFLVKSQIQMCCLKNCYNQTILTVQQRFVKVCSLCSNKYELKPQTSDKSDKLKALILKTESKIIYNSIIESKRIKLGYKKNNQYMLNAMRYHEKLKDAVASIEPLPLSLKYMLNKEGLGPLNENTKDDEPVSKRVVQFPYSFNANSEIEDCETVIEERTTNDKLDSINDDIQHRNNLYKNTGNWMTAYDNFENDLMDDEEGEGKVNYGTPDPHSAISNVPCGGCGALLHCKDTGIPGYIPSEIFKNYRRKGGANLQAMICQRCYFLNEYNLALQVSVSAEDYPKILSSIMKKKALVILMVDLMDFPCSIWPGIADILGPKTPIIVVGNKVDLLPKDGKNFFTRVKQCLIDQIKLSGFATSNILHVTLISAKNTFGIEDLITRLHSLWRHKGDVYLVGCTNVGKSSLFNALLQSDYCKAQASDLIQRATISAWPGTTLNMLKFPIMRPTGHRLYLRHERLKLQQRISAEENRLKKDMTKSPQSATLVGRIGQTFSKTDNKQNETKDYFSVKGQANAAGKVKLGIDEKHPDYALSRWCFDTPGVVQPDQILHLLTVDELMDTLPKQIIRPETFCVRPGTSVFIAGLARLDFLDGPGSVRLTVFRSNELPITICNLEESEIIYKECLGTELFKVPIGDADRLSKWPGLDAGDPFTVTSTSRKISSKDVVLSSAGWVSINCLKGDNYKFQAWTPEKRGIYIRECLLEEAVTLRGSRIRHSVAYKSHKFIQ